MGEEGDTVRCLAALTELERLHVTLGPVEQAHGSHYHHHGVGAHAGLGPAREHRRRQNGDFMEVTGSKPRRDKLSLGIRLLQPLVRIVTLQEVHVEEPYVVDRGTWDRIKEMRGRPSLPLLTPGSLSTKTLGYYANALA